MGSPDTQCRTDLSIRGPAVSAYPYLERASVALPSEARYAGDLRNSAVKHSCTILLHLVQHAEKAEGLRMLQAPRWPWFPILICASGPC